MKSKARLGKNGNMFYMDMKSTPPLPRRINIGGVFYNRFMDRIYIKGRTFDLDEEIVKEINNIRFKYKDILIDKEYNKAIINFISQKVVKYINIPQIKVLDFGCGEGIYINEIKKYFTQIELHGVDIREIQFPDNFFDIYKSFNPIKTISNLPFSPCSFDMIVGFFVFHFKIYDVQLKSMYTILKEGGLLCFNMTRHTNVPIISKLKNIGFSIIEHYKTLLNERPIEYFIMKK